MKIFHKKPVFILLGLCFYDILTKYLFFRLFPNKSEKCDYIFLNILGVQVTQLNPNSHGVGHIGPTLFERQIT